MKTLHKEYNHIAYLRAGSTVYQHVIDIITCSSHLLDKHGMIVFSVDHNARLFDEDDVYIGSFYTNSENKWFYERKDSTVLQPLKLSDLINFERCIFKELLDTKV